MFVAIRNRHTGKIIVQGEYSSMAAAIEANKTNLYEVNLSKADLRGANLSEANLSKTDLSGVNLSRANLSKTNFAEAVLCWADLRGANLSEANLARANLAKVNLTGVNLFGTDLHGANLFEANLTGVNLIGVNLTGANLRGADFRHAVIDETTKMPRKPVELPPVGNEIIGFKKLRNQVVVKVLIPADADRVSSWRNTKCRASAMRVLEVVSNPEGCDTSKPIPGLYDSNFHYTVGKMHFPSSFDPDQGWDCLPGLHFFVDLDEAMDY